MAPSPTVMPPPSQWHRRLSPVPLRGRQADPGSTDPHPALMRNSEDGSHGPSASAHANGAGPSFHIQLALPPPRRRSPFHPLRGPLASHFEAIQTSWRFQYCDFYRITRLLSQGLCALPYRPDAGSTPAAQRQPGVSIPSLRRFNVRPRLLHGGAKQRGRRLTPRPAAATLLHRRLAAHIPAIRAPLVALRLKAAPLPSAIGTSQWLNSMVSRLPLRPPAHPGLPSVATALVPNSEEGGSYLTTRVRPKRQSVPSPLLPAMHTSLDTRAIDLHPHCGAWGPHTRAAIGTTPTADPSGAQSVALDAHIYPSY